jgi:hypothetical protein
MKILLYATNEDVILNFINRIAERENEFDIIACKTIDKLQDHLQNVYSFIAVVLQVANKEELLELLTIQEIFKNTKIVLVLPDSSKTLIKQALKLYPRYMTHGENGFEEIVSVLRKICSTSNNVSQ